jgi:hypothetical protein
MRLQALTADSEGCVELLGERGGSSGRFIVSQDGRSAVVTVGTEVRAFRIGIPQWEEWSDRTHLLSTHPCAEDALLAWVPGESERFVVSTGDGRYAVYGLEDGKPEGRDFTTLGPPQEIWRAGTDRQRPSPDFSLFSVETRGATLWVIGTEDARRVAASHAPGASHEWSSDSKWLTCALLATDGTKPLKLYNVEQHRIWQVEGAGTPRNLSHHTVWSGNPRYVAFRTLTQTDSDTLCVLDTQLLTCTPLVHGDEDAGGTGERPRIESWTPDGEHLVYSLIRYVNGLEAGGAVWVSSADGTRRRELIESNDEFTVHVQGQPSRYEE